MVPAPTDCGAEQGQQCPEEGGFWLEGAAAPAPADEAKKNAIPASGRYTCSRRLEQDYIIQDKVLGSGMTGPVLLAEGRADGRQYAVKSFKKAGLSVKHRKDLQNEAEVYLALDHPHIAQLQMVFETNDMLHLVMECMEGGELYDRLAKAKKYTEEAAADTAYQMLLAVAYLHSHKIAHRDLKLENFLYARKDTNTLKLIDFGFAKFTDPDTVMSQACGSVHYVAPEVLCRSYTVQADMWSVGVIAYMLLTGTPVFMGTESEILKKIKAGKPHFSMRFGSLSPEAQGFVRALLVRDPEQRLTAAQALEHPWIQGRHLTEDVHIDPSILSCLRSYSQASSFRRAVLTIMAWSLTTEEQEGLREQFLLMDSEKSGCITLQALKSVLRERFQVDGSEAERLFDSLDVDSSEEIQYSEFLAAALVGRVRAHKDVLRRTFQRFDLDASGRISADELREVLGGNFEGANVEELIREVDTSGDGQINYEEFLAFLQQPEPPSPSPPARRSKRRHTVMVGAMVIDRLMERDAGPAEPDAGSGSGAPSTRSWALDDLACGRPPLVRRVVGRARTLGAAAVTPLTADLPVLLGAQAAQLVKEKSP